MGVAAGLVIAIVRLLDGGRQVEYFDYLGRLFLVLTWPAAIPLCGIAHIYNESVEKKAARITESLRDEVLDLRLQLRVKENERQTVIEAAEKKNDYLQKRLQEVLWHPKDDAEGGSDG